ncbi:DMT family transporter [Deltaproteobacteria bacterium]|nr:DMT family transporter [Deltaproteobacteria bacterium]
MSSTKINYRSGVLLVLAAGICWSSMGLGIRHIEVANVWQILFFRSLALTPLLLLVLTLRARGNPFPIIQRAGLAGGVGGISLVFAFSGGILSIQATSVANAMFLFAAAPFFAAVLGWLLLKEHVRNATWISMIAALVGIVIMVWEGISIGRIIGNVAALISALGFAVFTISLRWKKLEDMLPTVFLAGLFAIIIAGALCQIKGYGLDVPKRDILIALALGVFQVGAGLILYTLGSKTVPSAELALLSMTEVVFGPFWVWLFLGETAGGYTLLGGMILLIAIASNALSSLRPGSV